MQKSFSGASTDRESATSRKWRAEKREVFVSYRVSGLDAANKVRDGLGGYLDESIFLPRIDYVDLLAGDWMKQLMDMIDSCPASFQY